MPEKVVFTSPQPTGPMISEVRLVGLSLQLEPVPEIVATFVDDMGRRSQVRWDEDSGDNPAAMIRTLNTIDLSSKSLYHRVMERAVLDGKIADGSVTGTPG